MAEEEGEQVMTLTEFIESEEAKEESADLVLGGDDGKECTYQQGYLPRQAVFSCLTCVPKENAGVCTACSLACHDGHEVVELWTKRNFCCDCGNSKFAGKECKLWKEKDAENIGNAYNQNFAGLYCVCHRQYPSPEDEHLGEMLQCCICEDWFHETHLGLSPPEKVPRDEDNDLLFDEMICQNCVDRCSFLFRYPELLIAPSTHRETAPEVDDENRSNTEANANAEASAEAHPANGKVEQSPEEHLGSEAASSGKKEENLDVAGCSESGSSICKLKPVESADGNRICSGKALFLSRSWRIEICQCSSCVETYRSKGLIFLLEKLDTLQSYEALARQRRKVKLEQVDGAALKMIHNLDHVRKVEFLNGLSDMTSELNSFLGDFSNSGKTVTSADVYEFFDKLKQKRRKLT